MTVHFYPALVAAVLSMPLTGKHYNAMKIFIQNKSDTMFKDKKKQKYPEITFASFCLYFLNNFSKARKAMGYASSPVKFLSIIIPVSTSENPLNSDK